MEHMERAKKTAHDLGQATGFKQKTGFLERVAALFRSTKEKQLKKQEDAALFATLKATQSERDTIRRNLHYITEVDCAEVCIYRLKAAELDFNRYIRLAKETRFSVSSYLEDSL